MSTTETDQTFSPLLTPAECAAWLGLTPKFIRDHEEELGVVRIAGRYTRFPLVGLVERASRIP